MIKPPLLVTMMTRTMFTKNKLSTAEFELIDFSRRMLVGAKKKLGTGRAKFILADYSKKIFQKNTI